MVYVGHRSKKVRKMLSGGNMAAARPKCCLADRKTGMAFPRTKTNIHNNLSSPHRTDHRFLDR